MSGTWKPIEDLPSDYSSLTDGELGPLRQVWEEQRTNLEVTGALKKFNDELAREWAIETGQIEGIYDLDRGTTRTLIERGINADLIPRAAGQKSPELIAAILRDHAEVLEGLFQFVKGERGLTKGYIHELHAALLKQQETVPVMDQSGNVFETELLKGRYKERPNNPARPDGTVHQYCPPEHVDTEMERLLSMHDRHEVVGIPMEIEAAWLHHRFTEIHPYQDGNGRVARALASLVFIKAGWFAVVVARDDRARYIDALELADEGDLGPLVSFFVDAQRRSLFQATKIAADMLPVQTVDDAIDAFRRVIEGSGGLHAKWLRAHNTAEYLLVNAEKRLGQVIESLKREIPTISSNISSAAGDSNLPLITAALGISPAQQVFLWLKGRSIGSTSDGLISIEVLLYEGSRGGRLNDSEEPFQVNYVESRESAERRFRPWLEKALIRALTLWRQSL